MTTALVDLSNACRGEAVRGWDGYVLLRQRLLDDGFEYVRAIGDSTLRYRLPASDVGHLEAAIGSREVQLVPYADPRLIEAAFADETITIVTNDRFEALRPGFPGLDGFTRVMAFRFDGADVHLYPSPLVSIGPSAVARAVHAEALERSRRHEEDHLSGLGYRTDDDRELLSWDWRCDTDRCPAGALPQLDELPVCERGNAICGDCRGSATRLGLAVGGREVKVLVDGEVRERFALAVGTRRRVGRGAGPGRFDISPLLDGDAADLVSRRHVEVANHDGKLRVHEFGSSNGTRIVRTDGSEDALAEGSTVVIGVEDRVSLAGVIELQLSARRWPRASFVAITDPAAPGETVAVLDD